MSRIEKLLPRLQQRPKDFTYDELASLLGSLECEIDKAGKTAGSRVAFIHCVTKTILRLHRPHPGNE